MIFLKSKLSDKIMHSYHHPPKEGIILCKAINRKINHYRNRSDMCGWTSFCGKYLISTTKGFDIWHSEFLVPMVYFMFIVHIQMKAMLASLMMAEG